MWETARPLSYDRTGDSLILNKYNVIYAIFELCDVYFLSHYAMFARSYIHSQAEDHIAEFPHAGPITALPKC